MPQQQHIIYVTGILDNVLHLQSVAIRTWRLYGVHGHCHVMPWFGQESFEPKFQRLLDEIDMYRAQGHTVSLVGASAGASAVLNAYVTMPDKIAGVVLVCPKIHGPETVSKKTYAENPAFKESLERLQSNLKKLTKQDKATKIRTYYSPADGVIPYEASTISGVPEKRLPAIRHGRAIMYAVTFGAPGLIRFLKQLQRKAV